MFLFFYSSIVKIALIVINSYYKKYFKMFLFRLIYTNVLEVLREIPPFA